MTRPELARLLREKSIAQGMKRIRITESDPRKFMAAFARAVAGDGEVFLCNPDWGWVEQRQLEEMLKQKPETGDLKPETGGEVERGRPRPRNADRVDGAPAPVQTGSSGPQVSAFKPQVPIKSEEDLFAALGLAFIPPELREGLGEIEAAEAGKLPELVTEADIRGVFHNHTTASDGHNTLEEMTAAAEALGFDYLGIADHSKSSFQARGLDEARLAEQVAAIRRLNESKRFKTWVFSGTECDILPDGRLDFSAEVLAALDYVVVSVHSSFRQDRETMTRRIIRAIEHPHVTMLGHLTGRLLLEREAYEVDADRVIDAAIAHGVVIELNASPLRLDMDWRRWRKAAEKGLLTSLNPDAHRTAQLEYFRCGVGAARKGWLTKASVLNTKPRAEMKRWLAER